MAKKYSELYAENPADTLTGDEVFAITQDGESRGVSVQEIADFSGGGNGFTWITAAPSLPQATDKHYVVEPGTATFAFLGFDIEAGMEIYVKAGATTMAGVVIKP
jgi:hypothetical protein